MRNYRLGIWAGIAGSATIMIVGGLTIVMVAIIIGLIIGLMSSYNESIGTPQEGLRYGVINGVIAGALMIAGQLLRSLWIDPLAGQRPLDIGFGVVGSAIVVGLIALVIAAVVGGALSAGQHMKGPGRSLVVAAIVGGYLLFLPQIDNALKLGWLGDIIPIILFII